jgi:hypothetical protein
MMAQRVRSTASWYRDRRRGSLALVLAMVLLVACATAVLVGDTPPGPSSIEVPAGR